MEAIGFFDTSIESIRVMMSDLCETTDLEESEIFELVERAQTRWDRIKIDDAWQRQRSGDRKYIMKGIDND
jgi:hypothetical protein